MVSLGWDKYGGRIEGTITAEGVGDFAAAMIAAGHAKPWSGRGPRPV